MTHINITYSPYKLTTAITINGKKPKSASFSDLNGRRLQAWVDDLPEMLIKECDDNTFEMSFVGTRADYTDLREAIDYYNHKYAGVAEKAINVKYKSELKTDIADVPTKLHNSLPFVSYYDYKEEQFIEDTPIGETYFNIIKPLIEIIEEANNQSVRINLFTSRISEKSPIINYDLGIELKKFGVGINASGINNEPTTEKLESMLDNTETSLFWYEIDGRNPDIDKDDALLRHVGGIMKSGGKHVKDRCFFIVNNLDAFDTEVDGADCISKTLENVKNLLETKGISDPNIYPLASNPSLHLEKYCEYSHLSHKPKGIVFSHLRNANAMVEITKDSELLSLEEGILHEIHTGVESILQAVVHCVNKYAPTEAVNKLIDSLQIKLNEFADTEDEMGIRTIGYIKGIITDMVEF